MSDHHFRLSDARLARIQPLPPDQGRGVPGAGGRRDASGIVHAVRDRSRRRDAPPGHGPRKTLRGRFARWSRFDVLACVFETLPRRAGRGARR